MSSPGVKMKNDSVIYPPKITSCENNLSLKRRLYSLEYERRLKIRELDTKKKQFFHEHRAAALGRKWQQRQPVNARDIIQEKIKRQMEQEKQSAKNLLSRSSDFIQELRVRPLSMVVKMENKSAQAEEESSFATESESVETPQRPINKVMSLYQKGVSDILRREREKCTNPFLQSVDAILEDLRDNKDGGKRDPMKSYTRNILSKYAGLNVEGAETISEECETKSENLSMKSELTDKNFNIDEQKVEADADEYLEAIKDSSKGLQLWARVRKEQKSVSLNNKGKNRCDFGTIESTTNKTSFTSNEATRKRGVNKPILNLSVSKCRTSPTRPPHPKSPTSPSLHLTPSKKNYVSPYRTPIKSAGGDEGGSNTNTLLPNAKSATRSNKVAGRSGSSKATEYETNSKGKSRTLPTLDIEVVDGDDAQSHNTVVVLHEDGNDEPKTPILWDQSHRYSYIDDAPGADEIDFLNKVNKSKDEKDLVTIPTDTKHEALNTQNQSTEKEAAIGAHSVTKAVCASPETPSVEREEDLGTSALSMYSESESRVTTSVGTGGRSQSRQEGRKSRRLSVQTSGALRALSSVLNQQNKHMNMLENGAFSYTKAVNALADVASSVEEQARKLENIRRAAPGLSGHESQMGFVNRTKEDESHKIRRSTVDLSDRRSSSFVTNEVYKFLERRSSSKTMPRRQTLSKLELKLLSQAPGEDLVGRRNSISGLSSNGHQASVDFPSLASSPGMESKGNSLADGACNLLNLDRQNTPRRHSMSAVTERLSTASPLSVSRLSNVSENESSTRVSTAGKTLRSYSWAPDVSQTTNGHVLAMELLARRNRSGLSKFRTVTHMLKCLGEEYRKQTASMMYEELRYCTYLRLAPHQIPDELKDSNVGQLFQSEL